MRISVVVELILIRCQGEWVNGDKKKISYYWLLEYKKEVLNF